MLLCVLNQVGQCAGPNWCTGSNELAALARLPEDRADCKLVLGTD
jgi:hypothetical protein